MTIPLSIAQTNHYIRRHRFSLLLHLNLFRKRYSHPPVTHATMANPLYQYDPSLAAAVIFLIIFVGSAILHTWQIIRTKNWYFIPFLVGTLGEVPHVCLDLRCIVANSPVSRGHWMYWKGYRCEGESRLDQGAIHYPSPAASPRTYLVRRIHLHGPRPSDSTLGGREAFIHQTELVDQVFPSRRHHLHRSTRTR